MIMIPIYKLIEAKHKAMEDGSTVDPWVEKILATINEDEIGFYDCVEVPPEAIKKPVNSEPC